MFWITIALTAGLSSFPGAAWSAEQESGNQAEAAERSVGPEESLQDAELLLLDVIDLTLENDPNILLVESRMRAAEGALTGSRGLFDFT
ncbi:MAG: hypothetical protein AAF368_16750, partial [Planctomycetota bacterium]